MKSIIFIDAKNSCTCTLVTNSDNGTNAVYLQIDSDTSLNPKLNIESVNGYDAQIIAISESPYIYKIPVQYFTASTIFKFKITDDTHTCDMFSVAFPIVITGNTVLRKIDNFNYAISCPKEPVNYVTESDLTEAKSEVLQLANDYTDSKTKTLESTTQKWYPTNSNYDEVQLQLVGSGATQTLGIVTYKDGSTVKFYNLPTLLDNCEDSGWKNATLGSNFALYTSGQNVQYRKIGKVVHVGGVVKPASDIAGSSTVYTIFTLPSGYRPSVNEYFVCQGSYKNTWLCTVGTNGNVTFSRYGTTSFTTCTNSHWLPFNFTFMVD